MIYFNAVNLYKGVWLKFMEICLDQNRHFRLFLIFNKLFQKFLRTENENRIELINLASSIVLGLITISPGVEITLVWIYNLQNMHDLGKFCVKFCCKARNKIMEKGVWQLKFENLLKMLLDQKSLDLDG
jgi:hypothetical protein